MKFGRTCVQGVELSCNSKESAPIHGNWNVVMGLRGEIITVSLKMTGSRTPRCRRRSGVWTPCYRQVVFLRIG